MDRIKDLVRKTHLTYRQVEALYIWSKIGVGKVRIGKNKVKLASKIVSIGSFYRVLTQARENVSRAISTLFLLNACGLIADEELRRLVEKFLSIPPEERLHALRDIISLL